MSAQRARSAVDVDHRSAHPNLPGVPWWGAVLVAATFIAIGFAFDAGSGSKQLSVVFAGAYAVGCVLAVLAVRQAGVFTAVIQPPLLLFVSVPTAYFLFTGGQSTDLKDTLINCGYPLIERFPLMFFTSAVVLLIGMGRWYYGMTSRRGASRSSATDATGSGGGLASKFSSLLSRHDAADEEDVEQPPRRPAADRPTRTTRPATGATNRKTSSRATPSRSRHTRPPETEVIQPVAGRPRRRTSSRQSEPPMPPTEPRRRPRPPSSTRRRTPPPTDRRTGYERPEHLRRFDDYEPLEPHGGNGNGTHHPISRVRYRGAEDDDRRAEYRTRRRSPRDWEADRGEYEV